MEGDLVRAEPLYEESLRLDREREDPDAIVSGLVSLGTLAIRAGSGERAQAKLVEAFEIAVKSGSRFVGLQVLDLAFGLAALRGECDRAARLLGSIEMQRQ